VFWFVIYIAVRINKIVDETPHYTFEEFQQAWTPFIMGTAADATAAAHRPIPCLPVINGYKCRFTFGGGDSCGKYFSTQASLRNHLSKEKHRNQDSNTLRQDYQVLYKGNVTTDPLIMEVICTFALL